MRSEIKRKREPAEYTARSYNGSQQSTSLEKIATSCELMMFNGLIKRKVLCGYDGLTLKNVAG